MYQQAYRAAVVLCMHEYLLTPSRVCHPHAVRCIATNKLSLSPPEALSSACKLLHEAAKACLYGRHDPTRELLTWSFASDKWEEDGGDGGMVGSVVPQGR